jgi:hypothetical protein
MIKIYSGILGIFAVVAIVAASAYALFSDTVTLSGIALGTVTPNLEVGLNVSDTMVWQSSFSLTGYNLFEPLLPGEVEWGEFWLRNTSNGTVDPMNMNLKATLTGTPSGNWNLLKDAILMRVCIYDSTPGEHCDTDNTTEYHTLATWNSTDIALPGSALIQGTTTHYAINFLIPASYSNEIAGKQITGVNFAVTGTQAN